MWWLLFLVGCGSDSGDTAQALVPPPIPRSVTDQIDPHNIKTHTDVLADDAYGGRIPGSPGAIMAREYIQAQMIEIGLEPLGMDNSYVYTYPNQPGEGYFMLDDLGNVVDHATTEGVNLVGAIPGTDPEHADEVVVVMAHYDHLGVDSSGDSFNGAFDNAAAVAMNLELARVFIENGVSFGRTVVFMFTDDEEFGLDGAREWIGEPTVPQEKVVFGVSTDPLGRKVVPDFGPIALMGLERSTGLSEIWAEAATHINAPVYQIHRDIIPIFSSDQDPFWEQETPALWFTNIGFSFYHTVDDTADTIDYVMMLENAHLLAYALKLIGDDAQRYTFLGQQPVKGVHAQAAKEVFEDIKESNWLSQDDKDFADTHIEKLDLVIEADSEDAVDNPEIAYTAALYFLLYDLPGKYPGEIPPPWPEGW